MSKCRIKGDARNVIISNLDLADNYGDRVIDYFMEDVEKTLLIRVNAISHEAIHDYESASVFIMDRIKVRYINYDSIFNTMLNWYKCGDRGGLWQSINTLAISDTTKKFLK